MKNLKNLIFKKCKLEIDETFGIKVPALNCLILTEVDIAIKANADRKKALIHFGNSITESTTTLSILRINDCENIFDFVKVLVLNTLSLRYLDLSKIQLKLD